jgi:hypothetical protein
LVPVLIRLARNRHRRKGKQLAKKKTKKQLKRERREAMERVRRERDWAPPPQPDPHEQELLLDMMPLVEGMEEEDLSADLFANPLLVPVLGSGKLVDEPEFDGIYFSPQQSVFSFVEVGEERGLAPDESDGLPEEEQDDLHLDIVEEMIGRLLTEELGEEIIDALERLRQRARRQSQEKLAAQAAAILSFLGEAPVDSGIWTSVGVVQALAQRSLSAGFEVAAIVSEMEEKGEIPPWITTKAQFAEEFSESPIVQKVEAVFERYPGLVEFMAEENDRMWEEGLEALFSGELYLDLFTFEELEPGFELFENTLGAVAGEFEATSPDFLQAGEAFAAGIGEYLTSLLTPERTEAVLGVLDEILEEQMLGASWANFVMMFKDELAQSDPEEIVSYLSRVYVGELRAVEEYEE